MGVSSVSGAGERLSLSGIGHGGIGYGRFGELTRTEQALLLAWVRVRRDPEGKAKPKKGKAGIEAIKAALASYR